MLNRFIKAAFPAALAALLLAGCATAGRQNVVVVSGVGTVRAQPDSINMTISLAHTASTTREAQAEVNGMVRRALEILRDSGVEDRNISTAALRFFPEYEWGQQGRRLLWQRAEQVISFSIGDASSDAASGIIDRLIGINGIELHGMHFGVSDASALRYRARELAYREAVEKAQQYARLSGQRIVRTIGVFEDGAMPPVARQAMRAAPEMMATFSMGQADAAGTALPAGDIEITARVLVEFEMR